MENTHYFVRQDSYLVPLTPDAKDTLARYLDDAAQYMESDGAYLFEDPFNLVDAFDAVQLLPRGATDPTARPTRAGIARRGPRAPAGGARRVRGSAVRRSGRHHERH